jgi:hypothetical protein
VVVIPPLTTNNVWIYLIALVLGGGGVKSVLDFIKEWRSRPSQEERHVSTVDASIITVARARDELADDNDRLRTTLSEERARFDQERARWDAEKELFRKEIAELQAQIRKERAEAERRYDALLERLAELSARHAKPNERENR